MPTALYHGHYSTITSSVKIRSGTLFTYRECMDKIRNGDSVIYRHQQGTIYGKPRENKFKGTLYTVKVGDDYFKASPSELSLTKPDEEHKPITH